MESNDFKKIFGEVAKGNGFERAHEGWFKEFSDIIQVLDLQRSNYGPYFYLNIKVFILKQLYITIDLLGLPLFYWLPLSHPFHLTKNYLKGPSLQAAALIFHHSPI